MIITPAKFVDAKSRMVPFYICTTCSTGKEDTATSLMSYCHLFVNAPPTLSAAEIMKIIKGTTGRILKQEFFPDTVMQMWTRSYFVSTAGDVYTATIQHYVEQQKKRGG